MNKSQAARILGVSRPTLDKMIVDGENVLQQAENLQQIQNIIHPLSFLKNSTPNEVDDFLEYMSDKGYLSKAGSVFRKKFWAAYIKE